MPPSPTEFWGWCAECERWFYCGHDGPDAAAASECPVCLSAPAELDARPVAQPPPASRTTPTRPEGRVLVRVAPRMLHDVLCVALRQHGLAIAACPPEERRGAPRATRHYPAAVVTGSLPADARAATIIRIDDAGAPLTGDDDASGGIDSQRPSLAELLRQLERALQGDPRPRTVLAPPRGSARSDPPISERSRP